MTTVVIPLDLLLFQFLLLGGFVGFSIGFVVGHHAGSKPRHD